MYRQCSTEEGTRRQRQIEQGLLELMRVRDYHQITVVDICQKMSISRKSFYRYFESKDDCLMGLLDHTLLEISMQMEDMPELPKESSGMARRLTHWKENHRDLMESLCRNKLVHCFSERLWYSTLWTSPAAQRLRGSENGDEKLIFIISGMTGLLVSWHQSCYQTSPEQLAASVDRLLRYAFAIE